MSNLIARQTWSANADDYHSEGRIDIQVLPEPTMATLAWYKDGSQEFHTFFIHSNETAQVTEEITDMYYAGGGITGPARAYARAFATQLGVMVVLNVKAFGIQENVTPESKDKNLFGILDMLSAES